MWACGLGFSLGVDVSRWVRVSFGVGVSLEVTFVFEGQRPDSLPSWDGNSSGDGGPTARPFVFSGMYNHYCRPALRTVNVG